MLSSSSSNSDSDDGSDSRHLQSSRADGSTSNGTATTSEDLLEEKERMFQKESIQVTRLKRLVLLIMLLAGIAVCTVVYFITKNAEISQFESIYEGASEKLLGKSF